MRSFSHVPRPGHVTAAFSVLRAGHLKAAAGASLTRSRHVGQDILYCLKGRGEVESRGRSFPVIAGDVAWLANETPHAHRADLDDPWELLWLRLDGPRAATMRAPIFGENEHVRRVPDGARLEAWFRRLFATLERRDPTLDLELNQLVASLFVVLAGVGVDERQSLPRPVSRAMEAMREDLTAPWPAERLAEVAGIGATHLRRLFGRHLKIAPHRWLMNERLLKAQSLLADTDLAVSEIGLRCGFADIFHFSREFKRHLGVSPANWRRAERAL